MVSEQSWRSFADDAFHLCPPADRYAEANLRREVDCRWRWSRPDPHHRPVQSKDRPDCQSKSGRRIAPALRRR